MSDELDLIQQLQLQLDDDELDDLEKTDMDLLVLVVDVEKNFEIEVNE